MFFITLSFHTFTLYADCDLSHNCITLLILTLIFSNVQSPMQQNKVTFAGQESLLKKQYTSKNRHIVSDYHN